MAELHEVYLDENSLLSDISPLLNNSDFGPGAGFSAGPVPLPDIASLRGTAVSCADIAALVAKGASVVSDCP
jgi:hypothetical protein